MAMDVKKFAYKRAGRDGGRVGGRYWPSFLIWSAVTHMIAFMVLSNVSLSFIRSLKRPAAAYPLIYIGLIFSGPSNTGTATAQGPRTAPRKDFPSSAAPGPVKHETSRQDGAPAVPQAKQPADNALGDCLPASADNVATPATVHEKKPVANTSGIAKPPPPPAVDGVVVRETLDYPWEEVRDSGTETGPGDIVLIRGAEKSTVSLAELMPRTDDDATDLPQPRQEKPFSGREALPTAVPEPERAETLSLYTSMEHVAELEPYRIIIENPEPMDNLTISSGYRVIIEPEEARVLKAEAPSEPAAPAISVLEKTGAPIAVYDHLSPAEYGKPLPAGPGPASPPARLLPQQASEGRSPSPLSLPGDMPAPSRRTTQILSSLPVLPAIAKSLAALEADIAKVAYPLVSITEPLEGDTDRSLVEVKGAVTGDGIGSVYLSVNGREMELLVRDGSFGASAALEEGMNLLAATAVDSSGRTARDIVIVNYVLANEGPAVSITSPGDRAVIDALHDREVEISGEVKGVGVSAVRLYMNKAVLEAEVVEGRFFSRARLASEANTLYAEATDGQGRTSRSGTVNFTAINLFPRDLTVKASYSGSGSQPRLRCRWRAHPLSGSRVVKALGPEFSVIDGAEVGSVSVDEALPGIYTVGVDYDCGPGGAVDAVFEVALYGHDSARRKTRSIGPLRLQGKGFLPAVRVLMPECVFWEDDGWFSGRIDGGGYVMKYKEPEGMAWKEKE